MKTQQTVRLGDGQFFGYHAVFYFIVARPVVADNYLCALRIRHIPAGVKHAVLRSERKTVIVVYPAVAAEEAAERRPHRRFLFTVPEAGKRQFGQRFPIAPDLFGKSYSDIYRTHRSRAAILEKNRAPPRFYGKFFICRYLLALSHSAVGFDKSANRGCGERKSERLRLYPVREIYVADVEIAPPFVICDDLAGLVIGDRQIAILAAGGVVTNILKTKREG